MDPIAIQPLKALGYNFIPSEFLPKEKDEYHLRNLQNRSGIKYRLLSAYEIEVLVRNNNTSDDWTKIFVSDAFNPELVKNCKFFGLVRIGKLEPIALEYHNVCMPVGLYNSTIISCDFGDNVIINNVNYIAHYIIGNEVMLANIHELHTTNHSKFGNGIIKEGEEESVRIWMEVCNENAGRKIMPFNGMLPGDAYLWSKYRADKELMNKFKEFTERKFDRQRGYYGKIGDRTVIKNTSIIKDVWVGGDAYIKGANKLKNLTINSSAEAPTQIGEGCELVNGIIDFGCRIFYGVKAVRFIMASNSQLKYGARLINSYLGNNATISCCEVLNSLIFPAHEQHHNNSFLCAALVMGQSNMAAGATIGSNHNSRANDGELIAGRGFWPGLSVSLKHNSKFASYTLIAKGDYTSELNITLPFSLVSNDGNNQLTIMPAYWFMYNMYALARNSFKYIDRDKRIDKTQYIEYNFLAPDSINEIFSAIELLKKFTALAYMPGYDSSEIELLQVGEEILDEKRSDIKEVAAYGFQNSKQPAKIIKVWEAYTIYKELVVFYGVGQILNFITEKNIQSLEDLLNQLPSDPKRDSWKNIGGQLIPEDELNSLLAGIKKDNIKSWDEVHDFYKKNSRLYAEQKLHHAYASLLEMLNVNPSELNTELFAETAERALETKQWITKSIYESRAKDYENQFRKMSYDSMNEMEEVLGKLEDNVFIQNQEDELNDFRSQVNMVFSQFQLYKTSELVK